MAGLDLDLGAALPAEGERGGRFSHRPAPDTNLGKIRRRGPPQRIGHHDQGGQRAGQRSSFQPLDFHLTRSDDWSHPGLPISSVLLLETVPEQQPQQRSTGSISDGPSSSIDIDGLQHDGRPHSPLKLF